MSKPISKEHLAELIMYSDIIDDILQEYDFNYQMKMEFKKVHKAVKNIIKFSFGTESIGELDLWKFKIRTFVDDLIKDGVKLKDTV